MSSGSTSKDGQNDVFGQIRRLPPKQPSRARSAAYVSNDDATLAKISRPDEVFEIGEKSAGVEAGAVSSEHL